MFAKSKFILKLWLLSFLASNIGIAIISPLLSNKTQLIILQGLDFLLCLFLVFSIAIEKLTRWEVKANARWLLTTFVIMIYFAVGMVHVGFVEASIYLRMLLYPLLLMLLGIYLGRHLSLDYVLRVFSWAGVFSAIYVLVEVFGARILYEFINASDFYRMKLDYEFLTTDTLLETRYRRLFNLEWFDHVLVFKAAGPTFNYPSTSYVLVFAFFSSLLTRKYLFALLISFALILLSTKSGLVCVIFGLAVMVFCKVSRSYRRLYAYSLGVLFLFISIHIMGDNQNIHMHSLISTLMQFPNNPFGQGLGFGGSMTVDRVVSWDYDMIVGDSGLAILLNMMGITGIAIYGFYLHELHTNMRRSLIMGDRKAFAMLSLGIIVLVNSVLQELAIGPYGIGIVMLFLGVYISNASCRLGERLHRDQFWKIDAGRSVVKHPLLQNA